MSVTITIVPESFTRNTSPAGQKIAFLTGDIRKMDEFMAKNQNKPLRVKFEVVRPKRSLDANAYTWVLCDKIADAVRSSKELIYKNAVREVGVWSDVAVHRKDLAAFISAWESQGIGYQTEVHDSKLKDCNKVRVYLGSSKYDSKQMSKLIDWLVDEAKELDIETLTPDELQRMKKAWSPG